MRIVPQSAIGSYSPVLALPAPRIAGLLPARTPRPASDPPSPVFTFTDARLSELDSLHRDRIFAAITMLFNVAVGHALNDLNDQALNAALTLVRRSITGERMLPINPAQYCAEVDADLLEMLVGAEQRQTARRVQVDRELAAIRARMGGRCHDE